MKTTPDRENRTMVVLASTFPRWPDDTVTTFVADYVERIQAYFQSVSVIVPHYPGAKRFERLSPKVTVRRFRYAIPYKYENIAYGQFAKTRFYTIKAACYTAAELLTTAAVCLKQRPAIVNAHWLIPQGFVAVLLAPICRYRVVVSVHGADVFTLNGRYMRRVKRFILRRADAVIANSSVTQAECQKLYPGKAYPIIPMGVDVEAFQSTNRHRTEQSERFEILFVGRLVAAKGAIIAAEAVTLLRKKQAAVHLTIVGDGPQRRMLEQYIAEHNLADSITLAGWVQHRDLAGYYQAADVFVGPSHSGESGWKEAFGLVFAEAAAAGLPIIATSNGGIRDIVKDQDTGIIVPETDAQAVADALAYLLHNRDAAQAMGARARRYVRSNFSWEQVTDRYLSVIRSLPAR